MLVPTQLELVMVCWTVLTQVEVQDLSLQVQKLWVMVLLTLDKAVQIRVDNLDSIQKGANVEFASLINRWFKLVSITNLLGAGPYSALLQISPTRFR